MSELAPLAAFSRTELGVIRQMFVRGIDAFAALAGLRQTCGYEG